MPDNPQDGRDFALMTRRRDKRLVLRRPEEHIPLYLPAPLVLRIARLSLNPVPELIRLTEPLLKRPKGEEGMYVGPHRE